MLQKCPHKLEVYATKMPAQTGSLCYKNARTNWKFMLQKCPHKLEVYATKDNRLWRGVKTSPIKHYLSRAQHAPT